MFQSMALGVNRVSDRIDLAFRPPKGLFNLIVPNQLSESKRRMTVAEHSAVLAALGELARGERTTVADLVRQSSRRLIAEEASDASRARRIRKAMMAHAPKMPSKFRSAAHAARFKRQQREFDQLLQELNLSEPAQIQERNSLIGRSTQVRLHSID